MVATVRTFAFQGIEVIEIETQVHIAGGIPAFSVVGLPDKAVAESRDRVRAAVQAIGLALPAKRITVNLSPADILKEGSHFDLPIALGLMVALGILPQDFISRYFVLGELALDGRLTAVSGALPAAVNANARDAGLICPEGNGAEAAWAGNMDILAPASLVTLVNHVKGTQVLATPQPGVQRGAPSRLDLRDIRGQESAKRALEVAAAGGHNLLMSGPPGSGKSMLAARLPGILPPLAPTEALEVSMIHSIAGMLKEGQLVRERPFRDPHHSASLPALVGGGVRAKPGEISLAHHGVLFLDELPEFARPTLEALRQPMETGTATIARVNAHVTYPARFQLVAAMNPCRCGYLDDPAQACSRAPKCGGDYQSRLSGPILDRIDLTIDVPAVSPTVLSLPPASEGTAEVAARVAAARALQAERYAGTGRATNAQADGDLLLAHAQPDAAGAKLLEEAVERLRLSARAYHRVLRVARTLADLEGGTAVGRLHIAEAIAYRRGLVGRNAA